MHLQTHLSHLEHLLSNYLLVSHSGHSKASVEGIARELSLFSKSQPFMDTAFYLLNHCECSKEKTILLSSLIKDKFKYDFQSIPTTSIRSYYQQLCQLSFRIFTTDLDHVQRQLSLSLAYLYLNLTSIQPVPIQEYLQPFVPKEGDDHRLYNCYFQVLNEIASELDNSKLVLDEVSRQNVKKQIFEKQQPILRLLNQITNIFWSDQTINNITLIYCFTSWATLNDSPTVLNSLPEHSLTPRLFSLLYTYYEGSECAVECLRAIINSIRRGQDYSPIIGYLGYNIVNLIPFIEELIDKEEDADADAYIELVLIFCEKAVDLFAGMTPEAMEFLNKLVGFTRKTRGIFEEYCEFWKAFLEEVQRRINCGSSRIPIDRQLEYLLENLNRALCNQCKYPNQVVDLFQSHSQSAVIKENHRADDIYKKRKDCKQLFGTLAKILTHQVYVSKTCAKIRQLQQSSNSFWSDLQVLLFSLGLPLKRLTFINQDINMLINTFIQLIEHSHFKTPIMVKRAFLKLFRSLMTNEVKNDILVKKLFYYNSISFDTELLIEQADRTFCKGCEHNGQLMIPQILSFLGMLENYPHRDNIAAGVIHIICCSSKTIEKHLLSTLIFLRDSIEAQPEKSKRKKDCMDSLIACVKVLKDDHLIQQKHRGVVKEFVRVSLPFFIKWLTCADSTSSDENSEIEKAVKGIKYLMRCLRSDFWQFFQTIFHHVIEAFKTYPVSSYVYLVQVAVTVFTRSQYLQPLLNIYRSFCQQCFIHLCNEQASIRLSFLLDDFIGLNKRFFIYNPSIVIKGNQLAPLIDHCLQYIGSDTPRVARAAYTFFQVIFMAYWSPYFIDKYNHQAINDSLKFNPDDYETYYHLKVELQDKIHYILAKMLKHLSEIPTEMIKESIVDTLIAEIKAFSEWNTEIWGKLILPLPNDIFRASEKNEFMTFIEETGEKDDYVVDRAVKGLEGLLWLMSKRMGVASKRRNIEIR